jgi:hypothetical protein
MAHLGAKWRRSERPQGDCRGGAARVPERDEGRRELAWRARAGPDRGAKEWEAGQCGDADKGAQ